MFSTLIPRARQQALSKHDPHWSSRLTARLASLTFTLLSLIAFSASIPTWQRHFVHATGLFPGDWTDGIVLVPLSSTLFHDVFVITHTIRLARPPRPLLTTVIEAVLLLSLTAALTLSVLGSLFIHFSAAVPDNSGTVSCSALQNFLSRECSPILYTVGLLQLLGVVFGCLVWILHLSLAMRGALDVQRAKQMSAKESALERRRRRWREDHEARGRPRRKEFREVGTRTHTGAYETYGWYR